jgi:hypothetical protein
MAYGSGDFTLEEVGVFFGRGRNTISMKQVERQTGGKTISRCITKMVPVE